MGRIGAAHGTRGEVRITSYTEDPLAIAGYGPLETDRPGLSVTISAARLAKTVLVARLAGISSREEAEKLNGAGLYVARERLPQTEPDEFYHADLVGLEVRLADGSVLGVVTGVANFGADDLLDVKLADGSRSVYLPFTKAVVPELHLAEGCLLAAPPEGWLDAETDEDAP